MPLTPPATTNDLPAGLRQRIARFVRRRLALSVATSATVAIAATGLLLAAGATLDHLLMLPAAGRVAWLIAGCLPTFGALVVLAMAIRRRRASAGDLRRLDNRQDDMRAALNLAERLAGDDPLVDRNLAAASIERSLAVARAPLPPLHREWRRLRLAIILLIFAVGFLVALRLLASDLHTVVLRVSDPHGDYGSVGPRKFQMDVDLTSNPASSLELYPENADAAPLGSAAFQRETLTATGWQRHGSPRLNLADTFAGYSPLALARRDIPVLAGDRVTLRFNAVDRRRTLVTDGLELIRLDGERRIPLQFTVIDGVGQLTMNRLESSQHFRLLGDGAYSPVYQLTVVPRPTPTHLWLFHTPPAHYGQPMQETLVRDLDQGIDGNRLSGLPGARLAIEFRTAYGDDLDTRASYALIAGKRLPLRRLTSRNPARRAAGEKVWTVDFTLDDAVAKDPKLHLHLVTANARYDGQPIANRYDDPLLVHIVDDQPPTVEITQLPPRTHFEKDEPFAFRYRYSDDHGIAEVGLEFQPNPTAPDKQYVPVDLRPTEVPGQARTADELLHIIDLATIRGDFLAFAVVVKDLQGQEARSSIVAITMSRHFTEDLLPKLTGGWFWAWSHNPNRPMRRPGDLETPPAAQALEAHRGALRQLASLLATDSPELGNNALSKLLPLLSHDHTTYLDGGGFESQPFAYHHRDYPYYFRRQGTTYLTGLADLRTTAELAPVIDLVRQLADLEKPAESPLWNQLKARLPLIAAELQRTDDLRKLHTEIALRAALLRAAHLCDRIDRGLSSVGDMVEGLVTASPMAPPEAAGDDPWRGLVQWARERHPDVDRRQEARLVDLHVRNLNRRLAALHRDLATIQALGGEGLDARFRAVVGMVGRFGDTVEGIDRGALQRRLQLLARFIGQGALASETAVYTQIESQFPENAKLAEETIVGLPAAADYEPRLAAVLEVARRLAYAQLHRHMGTGSFPANLEPRVRRNQESRLRSQLELLNRQTSAILYAEPFLTCQDLDATIDAAEEMRRTLTDIVDWLPAWPALQAHQPLLADAIGGLAAYANTTRDLLALQRRLGMLADFAPMFLPREASGDPGTALAALNRLAPLGPAARERLTQRASLASRRPARPDTDAQQAATAEIDAAMATIDADRQAVLTALQAHLTTLATAFSGLGHSPPPAKKPGAAHRPPDAVIAGITPSLFDAYRPDRLLALLNADLAALANQPEAAAARLARTVRYLEHYPTDAGADALADPLADYLRARMAVSLIACDPGRFVPFAETYTTDGHPRESIVHAHFVGENLPLTDDLKAWIARQDYSPPALEEPLRTLAEPYLQAQRAGRLDAYLTQLRSNRLAELTALAQRLGPALDASEARRRTEALAAGIDSLLEDLMLYHREADDLRIEERWSRLSEQAEGLDRDLRAGRLREAIAPAEAEELLAQVAVFRETAVATVFADDAQLASLHIYRDRAAAVAQRLQPAVAAAMQLAADDIPALQRDLHLTLLASFHTQTWYRRKLQAELHLKERQLAGVPEGDRLSRRMSYGSTDDARSLMAIANLASFAWRSACVLRAHQYALAPTAEASASQLNDLAVMIACKALPEYYYDNFTGRLARLRYAAFTTPTAMVSQMLEKLAGGQRTIVWLIANQLDPAPPPPMKNAEMQAVLNELGVVTVIFQLAKDLDRFADVRALAFGDAATQRRAGIRIRQAYAAQGVFWRDLAAPCAAYLEAGDELLAMSPRQLSTAALRPVLQRQRDALDRALRYLERVGTGLPDTALTELAPIVEAQTFTLNWLEVIDQPAAAADFLAGYPDTHRAVISYLKSIHGSMYPEQADYQPRTRYKHALHNFGGFDFESEILAMELLWFERADEAHAKVYRELLRQADRGLRGETPAADAIAFAWSDYVDTKFRYLMAYSSPEPGVQTPPPGFRTFDKALPRHLGQAFGNALGIDLPEQDNALVRQLYFEAIQEVRERQEPTP